MFTPQTFQMFEITEVTGAPPYNSKRPRPIDHFVYISWNVLRVMWHLPQGCFNVYIYSTAFREY